MTATPRPRCPDHDLALRRVYSRRGSSATFVPVATAWECPEGTIHQPRTLDDLLTYLRDYPELDDWTSLPSYGGDEPDDTNQVWSWDGDRLLVGTDADSLEIVDRADW